MADVQIRQIVNGVATPFDPVTNADVVSITSSNTSLPSGTNNVGDIVDSLGPLAFGPDDVVHYSVDQSGTPIVSTESEIDDNVIDTDSTWSSDKISTMLGALATAAGLTYNPSNGTFSS